MHSLFGTTLDRTWDISIPSRTFYHCSTASPPQVWSMLGRLFVRLFVIGLYTIPFKISWHPLSDKNWLARRKVEINSLTTLHPCCLTELKQVAKVIWQRPYRIHWDMGTSVRSPRVFTTNRTSIRSALFVQRSRVTDRLTDAGNIDRNSLHLMRPKRKYKRMSGAVIACPSNRAKPLARTQDWTWAAQVASQLG